MLIAQISDLHLADPGELTCGVVDAERQVARVVTALNELQPRPALVLVTGDLTHDGRPAQVARARRLLERLEMPFHIIPGNHDDRATLRQGFDARACPTTDNTFLHYVIDLPQWRLIAIDSTTPGMPGGSFCKARAAWLTARLSEAPERETALFMHHPPTRFGILETDEDGFDGAGRLGAILARFPAVRRIFCGHTHLNAYGAWQGCIVNSAPAASGMELLLDLTMEKPSGFWAADPAFLLHLRQGDGALVTHQVTLREGVRAHRF